MTSWVTSCASSRPRVWLLAVITIAAVAVAYWPVRNADFNWDDDQHITANPTVVGPQGLREIWTSGKANYFPLTMTSFWVQHALWGLSPRGYHLVTVACHVGATLLLWQVLRQLAVPAAWLGAMLWSLHPVQVESVAWICELKNTQSAVFYLLAVIFFLRWLQCDGVRRVDRDYILSIVAALLAILSKSSTVMLPVVLGLVAWWRGHRRLRDVAWLAPFLAISLLASAWTIWEQKVNSMASGPDWAHGLAARLVIAGKVPWFYLGKLLWPQPLVFIYPRWAVEGLTAMDWLPFLAAVAVGIFLWRQRTRWPALFLGLAYFAVSLFPVLGLFDVFFFKYSFVGDHFQYLASMGPLALLAAGAVTIVGRWGRSSVRVAAGAGLLLAQATMARAHARIFVNQETLWRNTVYLNPNAWIARMNLGSVLLTTGRSALALPQFEAALRLRPDDPLGEANVGAALLQTGAIAEAIPHLEIALRRKPDLVDALNSLGVAKMRLGRMPEAAAHFESALQLKPDFPLAAANLANALLQAGRPTEAVPYLERAIAAQPGNVEARNLLATALCHAGRAAEAVPHYAVVAQQQASSTSWNNLASALLQAGKVGEAVEAYRKALTLEPEFHDARLNLALALAVAGRREEALQLAEQVRQRLPDYRRARSVLEQLKTAPAAEGVQK